MVLEGVFLHEDTLWAAGEFSRLSFDTLDFRLNNNLDSHGGLSPNQLTPLLTDVLVVMSGEIFSGRPPEHSSAEDEAESLEDDREKFEVRLPLTTPESFRRDSSLGFPGTCRAAVGEG